MTSIIVAFVIFWAWHIIESILVLFHDPLSMEFLLLGDIGLGVTDLFVFAEVRNKVVSFDVFIFWFLPYVAELFLGMLSALFGSSDVTILAKMWNKIVNFKLL